MLELIVKVININLPNKHELLEQCRPLYEYSWFIQKVKDYENMGHNRDMAITQAIKDCKHADIMADFMYEHGSEVANMLFGEYDEELAKEVAREEGYEEGYDEGYGNGYDSGYDSGLSDGGLKKLVKQVCTKLSKGKTPDNIADELEENLEDVMKIFSAVQSCGTTADIDKICEMVKQ